MPDHHTEEMFKNLLINNYANHVVVGVTGHRDLLDEDKPRIQNAIRVKLAQLQQDAGKPILLISAYAMGADQWVAECATADTIICLPLTMKAADYVNASFVEREEKDASGALVKVYHESAKRTFNEIVAHPSTVRIKLHDDYSGTLTAKERNQQYEKLGQFLVQHCNHLIALWDGVDGGGIGGTSDVVRMMVRGKCLNGSAIQHKVAVQHLHQLVVPRSRNRFPIGRRFSRNGDDLPAAAIYEWITTILHRPKADSLIYRIANNTQQEPVWYLIGVVLFGTIIIIDLVNGFQETQDVIVWFVLLIFYALAGWAYQKWKHARGVLLQFAYPLVIALTVLGLGTWGFKIAELLVGDSFFAAANLITLNTSVFEALPNKVVSKVKAPLEIARILGGFLAGYIFILAFALAAGQDNITRIKFWLWRKLRRKQFSVVVGNGVMAVDLAINLASQEATRIILLAENLDTKSLTLLSKYRIWILQGNVTSRQSLANSYFWLAEEVYVISESDEENFRSAQEMDEIVVSQLERNHHLQRYVHLQNRRQRDLLQIISREHMRIFSVYENTARRLLWHYPIDRFNPNNKHTRATSAQVIVVGFGQLGQDIAMTCLQLGHFTLDKNLHIKVYHLPEEQNTVNAFQRKHPELFKHREQGLFELATAKTNIQEYTFFQHANAIIEFEILPTAENELINSHFSFYEFIKPINAVSLYICLPTGLESASLLRSILPRIGWLKSGQTTGGQQTDVQVFCFYNFPDPDEEEYVEMRLNSIASSVPIFCFGNFIHECSAKAIRNKSMNMIAQQIGLLYACLYNDPAVMNELPALKQQLFDLKFDRRENWSEDHQQANVEKTKALFDWAELNNQTFEHWLKIFWTIMDEFDRESNIQAADHAWVKLRLLNRKWDLSNGFDNLTNAELQSLQEVEHRRWNAEKLLSGWLPIKDETLWKSQKAALRFQKYHHFLMTFDQLPNEEKNKDFTQIAGLLYFFSRLKDMKQTG